MPDWHVLVDFGSGLPQLHYRAEQCIACEFAAAATRQAYPRVVLDPHCLPGLAPMPCQELFEPWPDTERPSGKRTTACAKHADVNVVDVQRK